MAKLNECSQSPALMEYGRLPPVRAELASVELHRGMRVLDQNGVCLGHVAAVVVAHNEHAATHILLHEDSLSQYRHCSIDLIKAVADGEIQLRIVAQKVKKLPLWRRTHKTQ